ncbi:MAG: hypothetical protein WD022_02105 [Balneolaceae bacterium]
MKKKNKIEQELDRKEFENDINRDLSSEYRRRDIFEKMHEGKNPYVIGGMNFFSTLLFFEVFYWLIKTLINSFTLGFTAIYFEIMDPFIHIAVLILSLSSVIKKRSAVEVVIDRWPF